MSRRGVLGKSLEQAVVPTEWSLLTRRGGGIRREKQSTLIYHANACISSRLSNRAYHQYAVLHIIKPKADKKIHALGVMIYKRKRLGICQTEADVFGWDKKMTEITSVIFWRAIGGSNL